MKCPRCWAEKAYVYPVEGWKGFLLDCLFLTRMKCKHCFHKFTIPWVFTIGKQITPPVRNTSARSSGSPATVPYARSRRASDSRSVPRRKSGAA